jgi:outer membrane protease
MKNITALTVLVIIVLTLSPFYTAHCQEEKSERIYGFSFGTQFGFIHGQSLELVYPIDTKGELYSELRWDMKPVFYYGAQVSFGLADIMRRVGFFSSISYKIGVPADSGIMEDRDWWSTENDSLTVFSSHTNKTGDFYKLDALIGVSFPVKSYFYIMPFISGSWMYFSFAGRDGYGKEARKKTSFPAAYYPIDDNPYEYTFSGEVIRYKQDWFLIAAGFSIGTKLLSPFSFELSFQISPLTYCAAIDEHLSRRITFFDYTYMGLFLEPRGSFSFTMERIEFSLDFAYRYIGRTRGETHYNKKDGDILQNEAGAGLSFIDTRLLIKLRI